MRTRPGWFTIPGSSEGPDAESRAVKGVKTYAPRTTVRPPDEGGAPLMAPADLPEWAYIHIHNWQRHQHYNSGRRLLWIKNYLDQLYDEDYLALTATERGILHGSRLAYARLQNTPGFSQGLPGSTTEMSRVLRLKVSRRHLLSLNHAGWIDFSASRLLADFANLASTEGEGEGETEKEPLPTLSIEPALAVVLEPVSEAAFLLLSTIDKPGYHEPKFTRARFAPVVAAHPVANLAGEAEAIFDYETHGKGAGQEVKDGIGRVRNWLKRAPRLLIVPDRPKFVDPYDRSRQPPPNPDFVDPFELPKRDQQGEGA